NTVILPMRRSNEIYELKEKSYEYKSPLYGQHELALNDRMTPLDEIGIIVDDEWSAEALIDLGLPATTCGRGSVEQADWDKVFRSEIIIWPSDNEAGFNYGNEVAEYLRGGFCQ